MTSREPYLWRDLRLNACIAISKRSIGTKKVIVLEGELTLILSIFEDLRWKPYAESHKLSLRVIADESGVSLRTVHRISSGSTEGVRLTTLDALCKYFFVLRISELVEYVPDEHKSQREDSSCNYKSFIGVSNV